MVAAEVERVADELRTDWFGAAGALTRSAVGTADDLTREDLEEMRRDLEEARAVLGVAEDLLFDEDAEE